MKKNKDSDTNSLNSWDDEIVDDGKKKSGDGESSYILYNFLVREISRLEALNFFFNNKIKTMVDCPQSEKLLEMQGDELLGLKNNVVEQMTRPDSPFCRQIGHLWNSLFDKNHQGQP
jgi:hypothetical protein